LINTGNGNLEKTYLEYKEKNGWFYLGSGDILYFYIDVVNILFCNKILC
jgi:hypothetical protein